jgi:hypothetical protein
MHAKSRTENPNFFVSFITIIIVLNYICANNNEKEISFFFFCRYPVCLNNIYIFLPEKKVNSREILNLF